MMDQSELIIKDKESDKNELQFILINELQKIQKKCHIIVQQVDESRNNPRDIVHENLIREYNQLKKIQLILDSMITSMKFNTDISFYAHADG